ncbi:uncharacterized protein SCODWIG_04008 [Saccharomycodes ludwigii]|uniref:Uncharacterized protein n=1 Tax=Saccharomycodes ludwigii TaxID=36035 RepID=A0A376BC23_9ASCO|nr:uncharacterized protein SCODWIG_04008 [Saccharomycodes ludwigii]
MSSLENAITGALAGALANSLVYPLDVIKTILQTQLKQKEESQKEKKNNVTTTANDSETQNQSEEYKPVQSNKTSRRYPQFKSSLECLLYIYKHEGFHGLYRGYNFSIISGIIQSFNYWFIYTTIRKYYYNRKLKYATNISGKNGLNSLEELLLGIISGSFSSVYLKKLKIYIIETVGN